MDAAPAALVVLGLADRAALLGRDGRYDVVGAGRVLVLRDTGSEELRAGGRVVLARSGG